MIELLEHNKPTYAELCEKLESNNRVALIQATGTGKSYIIGKYIEDHCQSALILVPTIVIGQQWAELLKSVEVDYDIATYQGIDAILEKGRSYDLVVADEFHRLGSDVWGEKFNSLISNRCKKVIGATATPIRFLDSARNMTNEIFGGVAVQGLSLAQALDKGVLPRFKYIVARYENESLRLVNEIEKVCASYITINELRKKIEVANDPNNSIENALNENLDRKPHKIIVFVNKIDEIDEVKNVLMDIFPHAKSYTISSRHTKRENKATILNFENDTADISLIFSVDMLNEGIHIKNADVCIMLRNTVSPRIYIQQIGRVLDSGKKRTPVIFDFVRNYESLSYDNDSNATKEAVNIIENINSEIKNEEKRIIIKTYTEDIDNVLSIIKEISGNTGFTKEEEQYILQNRLLMDTRELAEELKCNRKAIEYYADIHGIEVIKSGKYRYAPKSCCAKNPQTGKVIYQYKSVWDAECDMKSKYPDTTEYKNVRESLDYPNRKDGTIRMAYGFLWCYT